LEQLATEEGVTLSACFCSFLAVPTGASWSTTLPPEVSFVSPALGAESVASVWLELDIEDEQCA
jgi:hypothetical protein